MAKDLIQYDILNKELFNNNTIYLEAIAKIVIKYFNDAFPEDADWEDGCKEIIDEVYNCLGTSYKITLNQIRKIYKKINSKPDPKRTNDILKGYDKDGITLDVRIAEHWNEYKQALLLESVSKDSIKQKAINDFEKILNTETNLVKNKTIRYKLETLAEFATVICGDGDCKGECSSYAGDYSLDECPIPPFHPNCCCEVRYEITDDWDDIEDLDLEVDRIDIERI